MTIRLFCAAVLAALFLAACAPAPRDLTDSEWGRLSQNIGRIVK